MSPPQPEHAARYFKSPEDLYVMYIDQPSCPVRLNNSQLSLCITQAAAAAEPEAAAAPAEPAPVEPAPATDAPADGAALAEPTEEKPVVEAAPSAEPAAEPAGEACLLVQTKMHTPNQCASPSATHQPLTHLNSWF